MRFCEIDLERRAIERGGWLSALPHDPGADPEPPARPARPVPVVPSFPAKRSDFNPAGMGRL